MAHDSLVVGQNVGESDVVVHLELVWGQIGALGKLREDFHAQSLGFIVELWLLPLMLLHSDEVFPLATSCVTVHTFFLVEKTRTHELTTLRGPVVGFKASL